MTPTVVVDTDVISFLFKGDTRAALYEPHLVGKIAIISFMSIAELRKWGLLRNWGDNRKEKLERFLQNFVIIHSDDNLCSKWADITQRAHRTGLAIDTADAWIAATALLHQLPLVTHNRRHFIGVEALQIVTAAP